MREKAKKFAAERFDSLIEMYEGRNFVEVVGKIGGDIEVYRIYANGVVTQR